MGRVYLVGAGPGDPELLTLKGRRLLAEADVVLYDRLVHPELLRLPEKPDVLLIPAGKGPGDGGEGPAQTQIHAHLLEQARAGKSVVRLKGGDPFVFGRGGEEALALTEAGIPWEYVPGVTSAVAVPGYAGIPVTQRDRGRSFTVVTGHEEPGGAAVRWDLLAQGTDTLIILMGAERLEQIVARLLDGGRSGDTPAVVISRGAGPEQQVVEGTLATLTEKARAVGVPTPAITVIGEVAALRERLAWWDQGPLFGKRIVVTRPREQASDLAALLQRAGAEVILCPTIRVEPLEHPDLGGLLDSGATAYDWVVFTSANGVTHLASALRRAGADLRRLGTARLAAIGPGTAAALDRLGLKVDFVPSRFVAEGVVEEFPDAVTGKRLLIPRAEEARELLPESWRAQGATVDVVPIYRTVTDHQGVEGLRRRLTKGGTEGKVDAITFTASSTVKNLLKLVPPETLSGVPLVCIGPITAATVVAAGLTVAKSAQEHTIPGLVRALEQLFQEPA